MTDEFAIDVSALRAAVAARNYKWHLAELAERLGVSNQALFLFAVGEVTLAPDVLKKLAGLFTTENR